MSRPTTVFPVDRARVCFQTVKSYGRFTEISNWNTGGLKYFCFLSLLQLRFQSDYISSQGPPSESVGKSAIKTYTRLLAKLLRSQSNTPKTRKRYVRFDITRRNDRVFFQNDATPKAIVVKKKTCYMENPELKYSVTRLHDVFLRFSKIFFTAIIHGVASLFRKTRIRSDRGGPCSILLLGSEFVYT